MDAVNAVRNVELKLKNKPSEADTRTKHSNLEDKPFTVGQIQDKQSRNEESNNVDGSLIEPVFMYEASSSAKRRLREIYLIGQYPCKIRVYTTLRNLKEIEKGICFISISSCSLFTTWLQYMFWLIVSLWLICLKPSYDFLLRKNIIRHILMFSFLFYDFLFLRILISTSSCSLFSTWLECISLWLICKPPYDFRFSHKNMIICFLLIFVLHTQ